MKKMSKGMALLLSLMILMNLFWMDGALYAVANEAAGDVLPPEVVEEEVVDALAQLEEVATEPEEEEAPSVNELSTQEEVPSEEIPADVKEEPAQSELPSEAPQAQPEEEPTAPAQETPVYSDGTLSYDSDAVAVTLSYGADACVPEEATLQVEEILEDSPLYEQYLVSAGEKVMEEAQGNSLAYARFFDITIVDAAGTAVEPKTPVTVQINLKDRAVETPDVDFAAVHFEDVTEETPAVSEVLPVEVSDSVSFDANTFSVYGVVSYYTVDFYYENGEFHLSGNGEMMLSQLFTELGISKSTADITELTFTDPTLVRFTKEGSDYRITSLLPFTSSELLTISFSNGEVLEIQVEDATYSRTINSNWYWEFNDATGLLVIRLRNNDNDRGLNANYDENGWKNVWTHPGSGVDIRSMVERVEFRTNTSGRKFEFNGFDTSFMFKDFTALEKIDFTGVAQDTKVGYNMRSMFQNCSKLKSVDLSKFASDGKVGEMIDMFADCSSLEEVTLNNSNFKTRPVTDNGTAGGVQMQRMFNGCTSLKTVDMSNITITGGRNEYTAVQGLFKGLPKLETVKMDNTQFVGVDEFYQMFANCPSLTNVSMTNVNVKDAVSMCEMFANSFTSPTGTGDATLDVSGFGSLDHIVNMDNFVNGCTGLKVLNLDNLDNSRIQPTNLKHPAYAVDGDPGGYKLGYHWGRELGVHTCTALKTLSAQNSHIWMVTNNKGTPGNEYFLAENDNAVYYFTNKQLEFVSDVGPTVDVVTKRDYIDLLTDRHEDADRANGQNEKDTNINMTGGTPLNGTAGMLASGVYTFKDDTQTNPALELQPTYYRISNITSSTPTVDYDTDKFTTKTGDGSLTEIITLPGAPNPTLQGSNDDPLITITYPKAAVDVNGKYHDVVVNVTKVDFTNVENIQQPRPGRVHDNNNYWNQSSPVTRGILQYGTGHLSLRNYLYNEAGSRLIKSDAGTDITFTISIKDALPNTSVLFEMEDLDVPAAQNWQYPDNDGCHDLLTWENVIYDGYSEGIKLSTGNDMSTLNFADHSGLVREGNYIHGTGSDPSTSWSSFNVKANAQKAEYIWTNGIGCTTNILKNTNAPDPLNSVTIKPYVTKMVNGASAPSDYSGTFEFTLIGASEVASVDHEYIYYEDGTKKTETLTLPNEANTNITKTNVEEMVEFGSLTYDHPMSTDTAQHPYNEHNAKAYIYRIDEVIPSTPGNILEYNTEHVAYFMKVIVSDPKDDLEMERGVRADVTIGKAYKGSNADLANLLENDIIWQDYTQTIWSADASENGVPQQEIRTEKKFGTDYDVYIDRNGQEYIRVAGADAGKPEKEWVYYDANNLNRVLMESTSGEVYPYEEQGSEYKASVKHADKPLSTVYEVDGQPVRADVHGKTYILKEGKYYDVSTGSVGAELTVEDGVFNPNDAEDITIEEPWEVDGNQVRQDLNGNKYYKDGSTYRNPETKAPLTVGTIGNVVPDVANDENDTRNRSSDAPLKVTIHGDSHDVFVDANGNLYYRDGNEYYSVVGTTLTPSQNGFAPTADDAQYEANFDIMEDDDGTLYYKSDGLYYKLSDGTPYQRTGSETVDRLVIGLGKFNNNVRTSDILISKTVVDDKTGLFTLQIEFNSTFTPKDYEVLPGGDTTFTKVGERTYQFQLKGGQSVMIYGVPLQTKYKVSEPLSANLNGFELVDVDGDANKTDTGEITIEKERSLVDLNNGELKPNPDYNGEYDHVFNNRLTEMIVTKQVVRGNKENPFSFKVNKIKLKDGKANTTFTYGWMDEANQRTIYSGTSNASGEITPDAGMAFNLKNGEEIVLLLPLGATVELEETPHTNFEVDIESTHFAADAAAKSDVVADTDLKEVPVKNTSVQVEVEEKKTITRTITYTEYTPEGAEVATTVTQTVQVKRTQMKDLTTGELSDPSDWTIESDASEYGAVTSPTKEYWEPDQSSVSAWNIDVTDPDLGDEEVHVVYTPTQVEEEETKTITRTITYTEYTPDGKEVATEVKQTLQLKRTKTSTPATGAVEYTPWEIVEGDKEAVTSPTKENWTPDQSTVPAWDVDLNNPDLTDEMVHVVYTPTQVKEEETKTITRTITYTEYTPDGKEVAKSVKQTLKLKRTKTSTPATGVVSYTPWEVVEGSREAMSSPEKSGWKPSVTEVPYWNVDINNPKDETIHVIYNPVGERPTPNTGDTLKPILYVGLGGGSLIALILLFVYRKKKDKNQNNS